MKHMKTILAAGMIVGMGGMFVLHTTDPEAKPEDLLDQVYDLLYPPMGKKEDYQKAREILDGVAAQQDDPLSAAHAKAYLADIYKDGLGIAKDEARGRDYFNQELSAYEQLAANAEKDLKGAAFANYELGHIYEEPSAYVDEKGQYSGWIEPDKGRSDAYFEQARALLEQVVEQYADLESVAKANLKLGHLYSAGHLGDSDEKTARLYYERVAHNRQIPVDLSIDALFDLANTYEDEDSAKAINYYNRIITLAQQARKPEHAYKARMAIGEMYAYGAKPDFEKARKEYEKIAELADAQLGLAYLYRYGQREYGQEETFPKDINRAEQYYKAVLANQNASEQTKEVAQENLGAMYSELGSNYYYGVNGAPVDYTLAREYLNKTVEMAEHPWLKETAYYTLGMMSYEGQGGAKDYAAARDYFNQVMALSKDAEYSWSRTQVELRLSKIYYYGQEGILEPDYKQAFDSFMSIIKDKNASIFNKAEAQAYIGRMYYNGQGVARDYVQAGMYSQNALANVNLPGKEQAIANYTLGMMFYHGHGVHRDLAIAREYLSTIIYNDAADPAEVVSAQEMIQQIDNIPPVGNAQPVSMRRARR